MYYTFRKYEYEWNLFNRFLLYPVESGWIIYKDKKKLPYFSEILGNFIRYKRSSVGFKYDMRFVRI